MTIILESTKELIYSITHEISNICIEISKQSDLQYLPFLHIMIRSPLFQRHFESSKHPKELITITKQQPTTFLNALNTWSMCHQIKLGVKQKYKNSWRVTACKL